MPLPSIWPSYARLLAARRPRLAPPASPATAEAVEVRRIAAPVNALAAYRRACAFPLDATLPLTYPHALASPLHLALLARPAFPVRAVGLVHVRNTIRSLRAIPERAPLDLRCAVAGPRETERGQEFDLTTDVTVDGALAWTETAVLLARKPGAGGARTRTAEDATAPGAPVARWSLPANLGRTYAAASGDWNPIHVSAVTARAFGFPRAIAHGMWSLARCAAELAPPAAGVTLEAAFKLPVLLPATVTLYAEREGAATAFGLRDRDGAKPHVTGVVRPA